MRLDGQFDISRTMPEVYEFLVDPRCVVRCLPDLQTYEVQDHDHFTATIRAGLGRLQGPLTMKVDIVEKRACSYARMTAKGVFIGSKVNVEGSFTLEDAGSGVTRVRWDGDARLGGRLLYLAEGVLEPVASETAGRFLRAMEREMGLRPASGDA